MEENENQEPEDIAEGTDEVTEAAADEAAEEVADASGLDAQEDTFAEQMDASAASGGGKSSAFMGVPIEIFISVGKARPLVSDLVNLRRDSVITLDSKIDDPVEIYVGDRLIARGELQEMESEEGQLGVRLTEVADLSNGV